MTDDGILLKIVDTCREIDSIAAEAYRTLAASNEGELASFWRRMAAEEDSHLAFWDRMVSMVEVGFIPQVFDAPHSTLRELQEVLDRSQEILVSTRQPPDLNASFLLAFRMEFYLLHPAFEVLFHYMRTISGAPNPEDEYESHIAHFVDAFRQYADASPEMLLVGETLSRLWYENRRLSRQTMHDELTGILNRRGFLRAVKPMLHLLHRNELVACLIMADIDNFKAVNDGHGHLVGDRVLGGVAQALRETVRGSDIVGRYGGEEFIIFFSSRDWRSAAAVAEKVRAAVAAMSVEGHQVTISLGVACGHPGREVDEDLADLIADADAALLQAKGSGKDRVVMAPR